jgi:hypothetical protein
LENKLNKLMGVIAALFLMVGFAAASGPAGTVSVTATNVVDSTGTKLISGTIYFAPVDNSGVPLSYQLGGLGQTLVNPVAATITNGAFSINLPDTSITAPANVCLSTTVIDNSTGSSVLGGGYTCLQPTSVNAGWCSGTICNFDLYVPNSAPNAIIQTGPQGPPGRGFIFLGVYASGTSYNLGETVSYLNLPYISLVASNLGHTPSSSPTQWALLLAANAVVGTPTIGQTIVQPAGTAINITGLQQMNNFSYPGGVTYRAWGDSMTAGFGVAAGAAYPNLVATNNASTGFGNGAVSGDMCPDSAQHIIGTYVVAPGQVNSYMIGFNDNYFFGSVDYRLDYFRHCHEANILWMATLPAQKVLAAGAGVTYSGTWTNTGQYASNLFATTVVGATATIALPPSTAIDVVTVHQNGNTSDYSISIDGVPQINTRTNTNLFSTSIDFTTNNGAGFAPYDHHFSGLPNTPHTIVITSQHIVSSNPNYFLWAQATSPGQNGTNSPSVYVGTVPRSTAAAYSASPGSIGPSNVSDFNMAEYLNIQEIGSAGVNVSLVDVSNTACFDPNVPANVQSDGIHPTALGDTLIATCFEKAMSNTVVSRSNMSYHDEGRWYKSGFYLGEMPFDHSGTTLIRGQFNSSTFRSTSSINTGKYGFGSDGNGSVERLANDTTSHGAVFGFLDSADGFDSFAFGKYATGFPLLWFDNSVAGGLTFNLGLFGKASWINANVNSMVVHGALQVPAQHAITGARFACIDVSGNIVSSATACSGT